MAIAKITTLTPVHIGSGTTYIRNIDFVEEGGRIGIVDANKVADLIKTDKDAIDQWVNSIQKGEALFDFLRKNRGLKSLKLEDVSERICKLRNPKHKASNMKEQYRSPITGACIPGSSIKGAIVTSVLDLLTTDSFLNNKNVSNLKNRRGKWDDSFIKSQIFGKSANEQSTRFLKLKDANYGDIPTEVFEIKIINKHFNSWKFKEGSSLVEVIPESLSTSFDMSIDSLLLKRNKDRDSSVWPAEKIQYLEGGLIGLSTMVNNYTMNQLDWEFEVLEKERLDDSEIGEALLDTYQEVYEEAERCSKRKGEFVLRVGGYSGWIFTTGGWVRKESLSIPDKDFKGLRKMIQKGRTYDDMSLWPKTRKVTANGGVLGFVKIKVVEG